jgi:hypothetical protein
MKLAALAGLALLAPAAARATTFDEYGPRYRATPASQLQEAACDLTIELRGAIATFELEQRFVNTGSESRAFVYQHALPADAVVTGFAIRRGGKREAAIAVAGQHRGELVEDEAVLGPDPAVLRGVAGGYELVAQPIAPGQTLTTITSYAAPARPHAGGLRLVVPGRSAIAKLAPCRGKLRATPGPGATVRGIRVAGTEASRALATFVLEGSEIAIDVGLDLAGKQPVVWAQSQPLADGWYATHLAVLAPASRAPEPRRVVFVIDGSRSMDLVGRPEVVRLFEVLARTLPQSAELEAIVFDRTATRVFGQPRPATPANVAALSQAIASRAAGNGSDLVRAFELARAAIAGARGPAMIVAITDGVLPELPQGALVDALGGKPAAVDLHAIVLDPATTRSPSASLLRAAVGHFGGSFVELATKDLPEALAHAGHWLRPGWVELALATGRGASSELELASLPEALASGAGFTHLAIHRGALRFTLSGRGADARFQVTASVAPAAPVAALALAGANVEDFVHRDEPIASRVLAKALAAHPGLAHDRALVVLSTTGRVAASRRTMIAGGGRYERALALPDPPETSSPPTTTGSAVLATPIARLTLERLFREQLHPRAYACYQRALGLDAKLAGTVQFRILLGRGEVTSVRVTGIGDAQMNICLADAAYAMTPPLPDFAVNADDQTIANYPLTFSRRDDRPVVVLGDADSTSPLDIDAIEGGPPRRDEKVKVKGKVKVDAKTPLGGMKPPK